MRMLFCCRINHTVILDDPFDDPPNLPVPDRSPEPTKEQLDVSVVPLFSPAQHPSHGPINMNNIRPYYLYRIYCLNNSSCVCAERPNRSRWGDRRYGWERSWGAGGEVEGERSQDSGHPAGDGEKKKSALGLQLKIRNLQSITSSVIHSSRWVTSPTQIWGLQRTCCLCANWTQWPRTRTWRSSFPALGP